MAQRKPPPTGKSASGKAASASSTSKAGARPSGASGSRPGGGKPTGKGPAGRPPARKGKSIVNQKQTPWGLIITTAVVVVFAAAVVIGVVVTSGGGTSTASNGGQKVDANNPYRQPALPAAMKIKGVTYRVEAKHTHVSGTVNYDATPPIGGNHSPYWADCTGTVYSQPIANENAVHMLEHGAIWITYNAKSLPAAQLAALKKNVAGIDRMALSPYPNLKTPISLQAWGYQLFVHSASDPRIAQFIAALKYNQKTTPEYGASCSQPTFKNHPSTFGHPLEAPPNGG